MPGTSHASSGERAGAPDDRVRESTRPAFPLARLRAVGDVAELGTDELRFDAAETAQLFTETYGRRLDPDVLEDLAERTEGWIASLQLVQAALRDRSPAEIRRFVRTLNGADHELYDYLAEEVVGDLEDELQRFLMETSILQVVTPELAEVVSGRDPPDVARLTAAAERLTLLSRLSGGPRTHQRYHPLVREFLEARLRSMDGPDAVAALAPTDRCRRRGDGLADSPHITTARRATRRRCSAWSPARSRRSWATASTPSPKASSARSRPTIGRPAST